MNQIVIDPRKPSHTVSPHLYGIFVEDINFAADGGLNANMVNNYSFDGVYLKKENKTYLVYDDPLRYWDPTDLELASATTDALSTNSKYAHITVHQHGTLGNLGYNGHKTNEGMCAMAIKVGHSYKFQCYCRNVDFQGEIRVAVCDKTGNTLTTEASIQIADDSWTMCMGVVEGNRNDYGKLMIHFYGNGTVDMDCISFMDEDFWNPKDAKWKYTKLRKDLVQTLKDLHPSFVRFPGGCIVEGLTPGNEYNWKDTVGPLYTRKHNYNLWADKIESGSYTQTFQIGFYEYFCLCEDLDAQPLPTLFAGLNCQAPGRSLGKIDPKSSEFMKYVVQNYLDLIAFANGDPHTNAWAKIRSDMGHPEPFGMTMIGIGNENFGKEYIERFEIIQAAIQREYPEITCVMSNGLFPFKPMLRPIWKYARKSGKKLLVDEHSYHSPKWFIKGSKKFDKYPRCDAAVYFGEYAANSMMTGKGVTAETANQLETALAEAAFLTGVERNSDIVRMTSYAPLLCLAESDQWAHNLIDFNPSEVCLSANYYVQQLFAGNVGAEYIPVCGKLPKAVHMSATANKENIFIKLVNVGRFAQQMEVLLPNVRDQNALCYTLTAETIAAKNRLPFSGNTRYEVYPVEGQLQCSNGQLLVDLAANSLMVLKIEH